MSYRHRSFTFALLILVALSSRAAPNLPGAETLSLKGRLGEELFFDENLSEPAGQSCSSCHDPRIAFTDPDQSVPTSQGVLPNLQGNRNTPTAMYAAYSPAFHYDRTEGLFIGGQFLDGRASRLEDQAKGPFVNPIEMANPDKAAVIAKVRQAVYAPLFDEIYGMGALDDVDLAYDRVADAIADFERSPVLNRFTSKFDFYLAGQAKFTTAERRGRVLFENKANCAACHPSRPSRDGTPPLFTDHTYDNIGVPKNPENLFYTLAPGFNPDGPNFVDDGLGKATKLASENGRFKVPTLRNVAVTAPYTHNGYFKTLRGVVEFYNTRDVLKRCAKPSLLEAQARSKKCWPGPEEPQNENRHELGALKLSKRDIDDLLAFLATLTDGYRAYSPWPYKAP